MRRSSLEASWESPERALERVSGRLKTHRLWDLVLLLFPPLGVFLYVLLVLFSWGAVAENTIVIGSACLLGVALLGICFWYLSRGPAMRWVARLIDDRVSGQERFLTLVTIDPARHPAPLRERLRKQSSGLLSNLNLKRQFPYRLKNSFWASAILSLVLVLLFHVLFYLQPFSAPSPSVKQLELLAQELRKEPRFAELTKGLEALVQRLQDPNLTEQEKQSLIEQIRQKIAEQRAGSKQQEASAKDLQRTEEALQGVEKGTQQGQEKGEGGGGIRSNLPQKGEGQGKESKGSGDEGQGESAVLAKKERQDGSPTQPSKGEEKGPSEGGQGRGESVKQDPDRKGENEGAKRGEVEGKGGGKTKETDIPAGPAPERFQKPGEQGEKGIGGLGYVKVELPEVEATSSKSGKGEAKKTVRPNIPVSNIPLPPASGPEGAREKQQLPLEYRSLIR